MPHRRTSVLACVAWLGSSAALAQAVSAPAATDATSKTVAPLTVHAPPNPKVIQKQTDSFVRSYAAAPNPNIDQIGRWSGPACVQVWGLPLAEQAAKIKARIESMAQAVGLPAAPAGCKVNVEIVFTDQPQSTMDVIARRWEPLLGYYHLSKSKQLKTVTHPIQAWYVTATSAEGVDTAGVVFSGLPLSLVMRKTSAVDDPQLPTPVGCFDRFKSCYKSEVDNVLILADSKALEGKPLRLVADDMVMLALSQPKSLDGCNALPSVIDRFATSPCQGRDPPNGLTPADIAYLTALYSAEPDGKKRFQQSDIAERMAGILIKADAVAAAGVAPAGSPSSDVKAR